MASILSCGTLTVGSPNLVGPTMSISLMQSMRSESLFLIRTRNAASRNDASPTMLMDTVGSLGLVIENMAVEGFISDPESGADLGEFSGAAATSVVLNANPSNV